MFCYLSITQELLQHKCMIPDCFNMAIPPAIYCGQPCIEKHVAISLKKLANQGVSIQSNPSEFLRGSGGIGVIDKSTNKIMVGICAPSEKELIPWLQMHPSYQVLVHRKGGPKGMPYIHVLRMCIICMCSFCNVLL